VLSFCSLLARSVICCWSCREALRPLSLPLARARIAALAASASSFLLCLAADDDGAENRPLSCPNTGHETEDRSGRYAASYPRLDSSGRHGDMAHITSVDCLPWRAVGDA
jgi:hypothetical protein